MTEQPIRIVTNETRRFPWWVMLAVGIFVIIAGLGLLVWPFVAASTLLAIFFGLALIANGLAMLVRGGPTAATRVIGAVFILAGVLAMIFSALTIKALVVLVGAALIVIGISWIVLGLRIGAGRGGFVLVPGVLSILGGVFALIWPGVALSIVAFLAGLVMLFLGVSIVWTGIRMRNMRMESRTIIVE